MRLDKYLTDKFGSRTKAADAINRRLVLVNGNFVQTSYEYKSGDKIEFLNAEECYVSAGGFKLSKAIKDFNFCVAGKIFADIGASTGGFTDCLFQYGAQKVYCIDIGENQLDSCLLSKNVVVIDKFNARNLDCGLFSDELDAVVIDVSFISLTYILEGVSNVLRDGAQAIALIKPQFECGSRNVGKGGIVRDSAVRKRVLDKILAYAVSCSLIPQSLTNAPEVSGKNIEYLVLLEKNGKREFNNAKLIESVKL